MSFEGATASAPIASEARLSVRGVHLPVLSLYVQMPPCAAPRMNWWLWPIARAPMRPLWAANEPSLRWIWTMGSGPMPTHGALKVAGAEARLSLRMECAVPAAAARCSPACSLVSCRSPEVLRVVNARSSCSSRCAASSSWVSGCVPGTYVARSPTGGIDGGYAATGPTAATRIATDKIDALNQRQKLFPISLSPQKAPE